MAHLTSFKAGGAVGVLRHDERTENDKVHSRKNECIDSTKTSLHTFTFSFYRQLWYALNVLKVAYHTFNKK